MRRFTWNPVCGTKSHLRASFVLKLGGFRLGRRTRAPSSAPLCVGVAPRGASRRAQHVACDPPTALGVAGVRSIEAFRPTPDRTPTAPNSSAIPDKRAPPTVRRSENRGARVATSGVERGELEPSEPAASFGRSASLNEAFDQLTMRRPAQLPPDQGPRRWVAAVGQPEDALCSGVGMRGHVRQMRHRQCLR
jgi:hypothetical protein